jgi:hypothetical protein
MGVTMMPFPMIIVGGHLMIAAADKVPDLKFEQLCKEAASGSLEIVDNFDICLRDQRAAHDQLAQKWIEFDPADRMICGRMATSEHFSSYVELLACLESAQYVKNRHLGTIDAGDITGQVSVPAMEATSGPMRREAQPKHPVPTLPP